MTPEFDFAPAAAALATVVAGITDDQLDAPTPCADTTVRDLLAHVVDLTEAFRQSATKEAVGGSVAPTTGPENPLVPDWRARIPRQLDALVLAWREGSAWDGDTEAGGVSMPAIVMARVALDEVVIHAWDLARATGQDVTATDTDLGILLEFLHDTPSEGTPGMFGPVVSVAEDAPRLDRVLALTGRAANWSVETGSTV
ncbi:TIGR03086 family metal-binding protein [Nocardia cyriacigeorgica]|uniref:TIGR03086 family protein n=1 Tax=Nocardia cyriacigeorgica TaxID=135487 RepID=A0A6P1DEV0_9NOCA|nr:TIGR03086 family metal-binding protein [Nocardia cyriacigeorgica]NEW47133.1 TIGR03086 family protein [Nocardia cyriacigeorgica]